MSSVEGIVHCDAVASNIPGPYQSPEQSESFPLKQSLYGSSRGLSKDCCLCIKNDEGSGLRIIVSCFFMLSLIITIALAAQIYFGDYQLVPHGSVATDSHLCSIIGTDILKEGGNAIDAAVGSTICMGVTNPHVTGLGGGGFLIVYDHRKKSVLDIIDFREIAPSGFSTFHSDKRQAFNMDSSSDNAAYIGVPGLLRGLGLAHSTYGKLPWKDIIMPSVQLARKGFQVPLSLIWSQTRINPNLGNNNKLRDLFSFLEAGQNLTLPRLADALEKIAVLGPDELYNGSLSSTVMKAVLEAGGSMTESDLANFQPLIRKPVKVKFMDFDVFMPGSPSGGPLLALALQLLQSTYSNSTAQSTEVLTTLIKSLDHIFELHAGSWGDSDFNFEDIELNITNWNFPEAVASHVAVADLNDVYVSVVSGLNTWFGSQIMTDAEFVLNNALRNFDNGNNIPAAGKRPLSLSTPAIVTHNRNVCGRRLILGASDATVLAQLLAELLLLNENATLSIEAPRLHIMPAIKQLGYEVWKKAIFSNKTFIQLESTGYKLQKLRKPYPSCNIIEKIGDVLLSHSDSRGGGIASRF